MEGSLGFAEEGGNGEAETGWQGCVLISGDKSREGRNSLELEYWAFQNGKVKKAQLKLILSTWEFVVSRSSRI